MNIILKTQFMKKIIYFLFFFPFPFFLPFFFSFLPFIFPLQHGTSVISSPYLSLSFRLRWPTLASRDCVEAGQPVAGEARSGGRRAAVRPGKRQMGGGGGRRHGRRGEVRQVATAGGNGSSVPPRRVKRVGRCLSIHPVSIISAWFTRSL
jgi:hypothetical protein